MSRKTIPWTTLFVGFLAATTACSTATTADPDSLGGSLLREKAAPLRELQPTSRRVQAAAAGVATPAVVSNQRQLITRSLMITDLNVVNSPRAATGVWSFAALMRSAANQDATGIRAVDLVRQWLAHWEADQSVNGRTVRKRDGVTKFINDWPKAANGDLDLDRAPFRLLAIVNRTDLRNNFVLNVPRIGGGGAGEGRFVFGATDAAGEPMNFTVIFEYAVKKQTFEEVQAWGRRWYALRDLAPNDPAYLNRLQAITDEFTAPAADPEQPPAGSALAQLRTNENAFGGVWELREFRLDLHNTGLLRQVTVKQTADLSWQGSPDLLAFVRDREADILGKRYAVPPASNGVPMAAGSALMQRFFQWRLPADAPANLENARQVLAFNSCNGCHLAETDTSFTHVTPRAAKEAAPLSRFLAEIDLPTREVDLRELVEKGREYEKGRLPLQFVH